jgi:AcrR family transcriptional regulator
MAAAVITVYDHRVGRWEPDAHGRLVQAAMELYQEGGFDSTTVAQIAQRAGLTERTFFRYFADKREVLFSGSAALQEQLVDGVRDTPAEASAMDAVVAALDRAAAATFEERREFARKRHAIITANLELRERELIKMSTLAAALAGALRARGVEDPAASLAAEAGIAVFRISFERWVADPGERTLAQHIRESVDELKAVAAG